MINNKTCKITVHSRTINIFNIITRYIIITQYLNLIDYSLKLIIELLEPSLS